MTHPLSLEQAAALAVPRQSPIESTRLAVLRVERVERRVLAAALRTILDRHDALRVRLLPGGPPYRQRFLEPGEVKIRPRVLSSQTGTAGAASDATANAARLVNALLATDFDLVEEGPLRIALTGADGHSGYLGVGVDHVALDARSFRRLVAELEHLLGGGDPSALERPPSSYADFVAVTSARFDDSRVLRNTAWWIEQAERLDFRAARVPVRSESDAPGPRMGLALTLPPGGAIDDAARTRRVTAPALLLGATIGATAAVGTPGPVLVSVPAAPRRAMAPPTTLGAFTMLLPLVIDATPDAHEATSRAAEALVRGVMRSAYSLDGWRRAMSSLTASRGGAPELVTFIYNTADADDTEEVTKALALVADTVAPAMPAKQIEVWFQQSPSGVTAKIIVSADSYDEATTRSLAAQIEDRVAKAAGVERQ